MRLRQARLGTLGLFGATVGELNAEGLSLGEALADVASVALVQDRTANDRAAISAQLQTALTSRVVLEQAKGVLAQLGQLELPEAFAVLQRYAREHNLRLTELATAVVQRQVAGQLLLEHAQRRTSPT